MRNHLKQCFIDGQMKAFPTALPCEVKLSKSGKNKKLKCIVVVEKFGQMNTFQTRKLKKILSLSLMKKNFNWHLIGCENYKY